MYVSRRVVTPRRRPTRGQETEYNRIKKLLVSEYSEFLENIMVEAPFAETTRNGRGIRQVSLGLTPSKLIVAADILNKNPQFFCPRALDPSIESFELVSVYPLQYVTFSVFSRRQRKTLKARFIDGRVTYYELGGIRRRKFLWRKWCELVEKLLTAKIDGSSLSETTAASSSSTTTLYILSSEVEIKNQPEKSGKRPMYRIWTHYGGAGDHAPPTWPEKDVYLGPSYNELSYGRYAPVPIRFAGASLQDVKNELRDLSPNNIEKYSRSWPSCQCIDKRNRNGPGLCDVLFIRDHNRKHYNTNKGRQTCPCNYLQDVIKEDKAIAKRRTSCKEDTLENLSKDKFDQERRSPERCLSRRISRFGFGVPEKCHSGLVLGPTRRDYDCHYPRASKKQALNLYALMENGVKVWEGKGKGRGKSARSLRHFRRYGLCTAPHFLHALGPWSVQPGERSSLHGRRSFSLVTIRRHPVDSELRLPVSRRQLAASISQTALQSGRFGSIGTSGKGRVVLFWTPEFWYRPRPAAVAYKELRQHLNVLRSYRQEKERPVKRKLFSRKKKYQCEEESFIVAEEKSSFLERIFSGNGSSSKKKKRQKDTENGSTIQLRRLLKMDFRITIWDVDSSTLARQLTLIDRDLFVRIPAGEIEILVFQRSSRNAPNLGAWIAFSHRISCLTTSEILAIKKLDIRTRIIARLINAANKCLAMGNFHSCRSILAGLQAPPVYRLRKSWSYLRDHHANRYETMERLCKIYKNPRNQSYQLAWSKAERKSPSMPYVGDLISRVLYPKNDKNYEEQSSHQVTSKIQRQQRSKDLNAGPINAKGNSLKNDRAPTEQKQGLGKRIIASVLTKVKMKKDEEPMNEEKGNLPWTSRQRELAFKYFHRWNNVLLKRKACIMEQERLKSMDPRMKRVLDVVVWLMDCQKRAEGYDFTGHPFAQEFLLKTRYREDRENFFISHKLEPSRVT